VSVPDLRIRRLNNEHVMGSGDYVLYWMVAFRRFGFNFALQRAVEWANELRKPLLVLEGLRVDYPWASDRLHSFVIDGMRDNARYAAGRRVVYYPYIESSKGHGKGLIEALGSRACAIVTDDYPAFLIPGAIQAAANKVGVLTEAVDSNGLLPMRSACSAYPTAYAFRRMLQKQLPEHLMEGPTREPAASLLVQSSPAVPTQVAQRWPVANLSADLAGLAIDHSVGETLSRFLDRGLPRYASERNEIVDSAASGISPYLHFGHVSAHEIFREVSEAEGWTPACLSNTAGGKKGGWWGMSENAEAFLDELVTWRELGFNACAFGSADRYDSLPMWARSTLEAHASDPRTELYSLEDLDRAETLDPLWNAAQRQLVREGRLHNYLRMLWGKKIIEWSPHPRRAMEVMIHLNNKYALDGRDPNSYSGISWCLGRFDRPWPERPVFGKVRYMSSASTRRKLDVTSYVQRYSA
jgi:deoxyribodipyrimidine photo-lyase